MVYSPPYLIRVWIFIKKTPPASKSGRSKGERESKSKREVEVNVRGV